MSRRAKSPTRAQLSSRLAYEKQVPKFLQRLQNKVEGKFTDEDEPTYDDSEYERARDGGRGGEAHRGYDDDGYEYDDREFEYVDDGSGRPPIPRRPQSPTQQERPAIPTRPDDDPGSANEDSDDEKPQVVVLKAGKHLTEREAENERRKERGLPPLPDSDTSAVDTSKKSQTSTKAKSSKESKSLSFSSGKSSSSKSTDSFNALKRKVLSGAAEDGDEIESSRKSGAPAQKKKKKDGKKEKKTLLSFGDDA
ncbi:hypothetical protein D9757_012501 [Collybiopsis confluens]|uniref:DUF4604 domain-containing protein n=1 Tax=Collybiopsis confluens TaxID=2823264 RepID=A0A8H5FWY9_9AGAR|nr:hypothetical protein D9757_012501 [Collybiopsis confluens]